MMNCLKEINSLKMIHFLCIRSVSSTSVSAVLVWELHWRSALYRPSFQAKVRSKIHFWLTWKNRKSDRQINVSKEALIIFSQNYSCKNLKNWEILFQVKIFLLRVNVSKDQSLYKQGSANQVDFHIYCSVFHADHHSVVCFS